MFKASDYFHDLPTSAMSIADQSQHILQKYSKDDCHFQDCFKFSLKIITIHSVKNLFMDILINTIITFLYIILKLPSAFSIKYQKYDFILSWNFLNIHFENRNKYLLFSHLRCCCLFVCFVCLFVCFVCLFVYLVSHHIHHIHTFACPQ